MASVRLFSASIGVLFCIFSTVECVTDGNCSEKILRQCKESFDENTTPLCGEVIELKECLLKQSDCEHSKQVMLRYAYRVLSYKLHTHASCIDAEKAKKKECNESLARTCYEQFNRNATPICEEVKQLQQCLDGLQGCHVMKHPSYTLSESILDEYRRCFFVNYSKILEVLERKSELTSTHTRHPVNTTAAASIDEIETSSNFLPYTFVVVATVCTCLFLVILVVFSVVRQHTSLLRRQRHSTVERPPIHLQISPCRTSQRTRRNLRRNGRRNRRRHMYVIQGARQTVSGFFEGNVPPPPYSAVLDETESLRAGDLPPPYQPQQFVAIGVIV